MGEVFEAENQGFEKSADIAGSPDSPHKIAGDDEKGAFHPKGFADNQIHGDAYEDPGS